MWVNNSSRWHKDTTILEKFFLQKVIQRCDFDEIISKRHKTTNGYVLVKEMMNLVRLTELRGRSVKTLIVLGEEAKSPYLNQNIKNDPIICKYFLDLKKFILDFKFESLQSNREPNLIKLNEFKHQLGLYHIQLDKYYHLSIIKELEEIELNEDMFYRNAQRLEHLLDIYLTFLIHNGYSASSITGYLSDWLTKEKHFKIEKFYRFFNLHARTYRYYLALDEINKDTTDFAHLLSAKYEIKIQETGDNTRIDNQLEKRPYIVFEAPSRDMNSFTRNLYDDLLKKLVAKRDRETLNFFNSFFESAYWSHTSSKKINQINLAGDPINVRGRERTLLSTLKELKVIKTSEKRELPSINDDKLYNAVYYYNLALGSKSIENSLALLWTAMESCLPYRVAVADVDCVRILLSKVLALGCISRDVYGLTKRFRMSYSHNKHILGNCGIKSLKRIDSNKHIKMNLKWLSEENEKRFQKVKAASDLLAYDYTKLGRLFSEGKSEDLLKRIFGSRESVSYQLQRIYINRNQIVHAGDFISEYTNLWMNMEWYVGKMLSFMIITELNGNSISQSFMEAESDYDYLVSYLNKNKKVLIPELPPRIHDILYNQVWQSF